MNSNKREVKVINISVDEQNTYDQFKKKIAAQKVISMALTTKQLAVEADEKSQAIGARILKKKPETQYPCSDEGIVITSVTMCWEEDNVYTLPMDSHHC